MYINPTDSGSLDAVTSQGKPSLGENFRGWKELSSEANIWEYTMFGSLVSVYANIWCFLAKFVCYDQLLCPAAIPEQSFWNDPESSIFLPVEKALEFFMKHF